MMDPMSSLSIATAVVIPIYMVCLCAWAIHADDYCYSDRYVDAVFVAMGAVALCALFLLSYILRVIG